MTLLPMKRPAGRPFDPPVELRGVEPLARMDYGSGKTGWVATSRATVRAVLADPRFSARYELLDLPIGMPPDGSTLPPASPGDLTGLDAPEHTRYRRLLTGQFTVRRMRQLTDRVEQIVAENLAAMRRKGPPVDLVEAFAKPVPTQTICELLGVPYEDREQFARNAVILVSNVDPSSTGAATAAAEFGEYVGRLVQAKRAEPTDDLLSGLTTTDLDDTELATLAGVLLSAGLATTLHMITVGALAMTLTPGLVGAMRDDTENTVEELLRYMSIVPFTVRAALEDVTVDGELIKAGETVTLSLHTANRDSEVFDDPDSIVADRGKGGHVAFGHGIHQCLGQQLARVELGVAFRALATEFPTLQLAVPFESLPGLEDGVSFNPAELPVTW
ncbi:cytochrome [Actinosynnema sp. ALI-1.44]|uniref:cytochrome P450 n=1 Tax=Actinosynnema sp. ALI-1.44 TaxID=1933779 RepID=UPI00097C04B3|nr:cytochrome P450 [Actinosynnema sp. ALI-1.44]ONI85278.1 cytochrome [Actinosynnema sp. ALI-1.44]